MTELSGRRMDGKTAVITGVTTGIGLDTAKHYAAEGARILITGSNRQRLDAALDALFDRAKSRLFEKNRTGR